jgi:DNA-binding response OmpR family regulator
LYRLLVLTEQGRPQEGILRPADADGLEVVFAAGPEPEERDSQAPDVALLPVAFLAAVNARQLVERCHEQGLPVLALVPADRVDTYDFSLNSDDFLLAPPQPGELAARVKQLVRRMRGDSGERVIQVGDLVIDQDRYEVAVGPRKVLLTFKEYQLLVLLASNPGRVYGREALLSQVWRYDYFGGTRTVDVHIRRLRSKIEDASHSFIETVWNVGYRFRA